MMLINADCRQNFKRCEDVLRLGRVTLRIVEIASNRAEAA